MIVVLWVEDSVVEIPVAGITRAVWSHWIWHLSVVMMVVLAMKNPAATTVVYKQKPQYVLSHTGGRHPT